jgi:U5 small nuclear ribonucleoprotein component
MEGDLYDEFGNYIGPEVSESEEETWQPVSQPQEESEEEAIEGGIMTSDNMVIDEPGHQVVLHEDKKYYPELEEVYPEAEGLIMEEDTQPITQPIIAPVKDRKFEKYNREIPDTTFSFDYLKFLAYKSELIRNIAVIGHLHHGKTSLIDLLVENTHPSYPTDPKSQLRFTDTREDEILREISIKSKPVSLILPDSRDKSYLFNIIDTPGHPNFSDEVTAGLRISDGVILVVDVIEGVMVNTDLLIKHAVSYELPMILILNKIDRLVVEMKMPPGDAYYKIKHTLDEINTLLATYGHPTKVIPTQFSPTSGNVLFASTLYGLLFSLSSFSKIYSSTFGNTFDTEQFAKRLWGDLYFDDNRRTFSKKPPTGKGVTDRTFVQFILEPLYKILGYTVSEEKDTLDPFLATLGVYLKKDTYSLNTKSLLKIVCQTMFGKLDCLVETAVRYLNPPNKSNKIEKFYRGVRVGREYEEISKYSAENATYVQIVKYFHRPGYETFDAFGRVFSGCVKRGQKISVLGESYSTEDPEDINHYQITNLYIYNTRYRVHTDEVPAGNWVLIEGIDHSINKTATCISSDLVDKVEIMSPLKFYTPLIVKAALEPYNPSDLPKMLDGLRMCNKSYLALDTRIEESGEHVIVGTGELYLDSILHDLRNLYTDIEIKLSDPFVTFNETVIDTSSFKTYAETPNKLNRISLIAEPLESRISQDIEREVVSINWETSKLAKHFEKEYSWDILASRNIWAFGPDMNGPNIFLNDIIPGEVDPKSLLAIKDSVIQGFQWACREGPLCDEPIRNVKYRMIDATIAKEPLYRAGGQIIPTARRVCYTSMLLATPRLMEPYFLTEIQCTQDCIPAIYNVLQRRRGHVNSEVAKPGSPLYTVTASLPVIDSFGFETDLRTHTSGMAFSLSVFDHWAIVPGDPLDRKIQLRPLEPMPATHLAREFMVKTRKRKGLTDDLTIMKFFDDPNLLELARSDQDLADYFQS